jgi:ABC-type methionine transport system ATPase subunit
LTSDESKVLPSLEAVALEEEARAEPRAASKGGKPRLPIFSILGSIDFSDHFVIIGDVGTGKSTVTPIH